MSDDLVERLRAWRHCTPEYAPFDKDRRTVAVAADLWQELMAEVQEAADDLEETHDHNVRLQNKLSKERDIHWKVERKLTKALRVLQNVSNDIHANQGYVSTSVGGQVDFAIFDYEKKP